MKPVPWCVHGRCHFNDAIMCRNKTGARCGECGWCPTTMERRKKYSPAEVDEDRAKRGYDQLKGGEQGEEH